MNGVESSTSAEGMVRALGASNRLSVRSDAPRGAELTRNNVCSKGFVTAAREMLTNALMGAGFVHVAAGASANFSRQVGRQPAESEFTGDLKPGLAVELASWAASEIAGNASVAGATQARVDPQRATALLR